QQADPFVTALNTSATSQKVSAPTTQYQPAIMPSGSKTTTPSGIPSPTSLPQRTTSTPQTTSKSISSLVGPFNPSTAPTPSTATTPNYSPTSTAPASVPYNEQMITIRKGNDVRTLQRGQAQPFIKNSGFTEDPAGQNMDGSPASVASNTMNANQQLPQ